MTLLEGFLEEPSHTTPLEGLPEPDGADWVATLSDARLASVGRGLLDLVRGVCGADFDGLSPHRLVIDLKTRRQLNTGYPAELRARLVDGPLWAVRVVQDGAAACTGTIEVELVRTPGERRVLEIDEVLDAALRCAVPLGDLHRDPQFPPLLGMRAELHRGLPGRRPLTLTCVPEPGRVGREVSLTDQRGVDVGRVCFHWFAASRYQPRNATRVA